MITSQLLGVLRERLFANMVGVGPLLDVYNASFRMPDLMLGVMASFVTSQAIMPLLYKHKQENAKNYEEYISSLFIFFFVIMVLLSSLLFISMPYILPFIVKGFTPEQLVSTVLYSRLLLVQPILLGMSYLASAVAQSKNKFVLYGLGPIFYSLGIIVVFYFYYDKLGIISAVYGAIIGAALQALTQGIVLHKEKLYPSINNFKLSYIKEHMRTAVPRSGSLIVSQGKLIYMTYLGSIIGAGAISIFALVQKIYDVFTQLIASSISTASLPQLSHAYTTGDKIKYKTIFKKMYFVILSLSIMASLAGYFFTREVVTLIYGNIKGQQEIVGLLKILFLVLPMICLNWYMSAACNSRRDTLRPFLSNCLALGAMIVSGQYFYYHNHGILSMVYASIFAFLTSFILLSYFSFKNKD